MSMSVQNHPLLQDTVQWVTRPSGLRNLVLKPWIYTIDWWSLFYPLNDSLKTQRKSLRYVKYGSDVIEIPKKVRKFFELLTELDTKNSSHHEKKSSLDERTENSVKAFKHLTNILGLGTTGMEILKEEGVISLSARQVFFLTAGGFMNGLGIVLKSIVQIKNAYFKAIKLSERYLGGPSFNKALLKLANEICCLVMGVFGMIGAIFGKEIFEKVLLLSLSTVSLILVISKHYYTELYCKKN